MDFISILPPEIIIGILSRLNVGDILRCKRVCKSWLHLVGTDYFVSSHFSRSVPGHFAWFVKPAYCEILEYKEGNDNQNSMTDPNTGYFNSVMRLNMPMCEDTKLNIYNSANGLLLFAKTEWMGNTSHDLYETIYICNPITREYICSRFARHPAELVGYGFGVSKLGKHTVLRVRHRIRGEKHIGCDVYILGSGSWRSVAPPDPFLCCDANIPLKFVNYMVDEPCLDGKFHWLNLCFETPHILCFDLETELFSIYDLPLPFVVDENRRATLSALGNSLLLCDSPPGDGMIIWLVEERGGFDKSWIKRFVITENPKFPPSYSGFLFDAPLSVVKAFKNGDYLMKFFDEFLLYQPHSNTLHELDRGKAVQRIRYSPSFVSLSSFKMENAISF